MVGLARPACATRAPGTHSQVVLPCMLTTHLASWLVSRVLKGRTLTATFTEAPAMAPDTPTLLSWRTETENGVRATGGEPDITSQLLEEPVPPPPFPSYPTPQGPSFYSPGLPPQCHCPQGLPEVVPASLPSHIPACGDLGRHPGVTWCPGPRPGGLYQFWLPPALVGGAPSYTWGLATPAEAVGETLVVGEERLGGTCGSRGVPGLPGLEGNGQGVVFAKVRIAALCSSQMPCGSKGREGDIFIPRHSQVH